ncbi:MAG: polar amino acid transport system substrate-binding protein [Candidatus Azotimanducaceae bacterium]|jgi:polar amino acid transport system substrate-binding protein
MFLLLAINLPVAFGEDEISVYTEQFYPMNYTDSGGDFGEVKGFATELIRAVLDDAGYDYEIKMVPWARALQTIKSRKNVIVYSMGRTVEREDDFYWIGKIWSMKQHLYGLRSKMDSLPRTLEDAREFRIGVHREDVVHSYLKGKGFTRLIPNKNVDRNIFLLNRERVDLIPFVDFAVGLSLQRKGYPLNNLVPVIHLPEVSAVMAIALSKSTEEKVARRLKNSYENIKSQGQYDKIMQPLKGMIEATVLAPAN